MKHPRALLCGLSLGLCLSTAMAAATFTPTAPSTDPTSARPKVGLVLSGGGARGAAHIGVLETLERLRVPVDCVAGTSFGALVAGAWAAGVAPAEMRRAMAGVDWSTMFQDNPDYNELGFRQKQLQRRYLPGSEAGVGPDGITYPPGAVSGQRIQLFINQLVRADLGERRIDALKLPLSIVATDLGTGDRVVFRDGPLVPAMRASMAVPGLVAPLTLGQRKLVDGGLVDNLPVQEVRERCGADVVIAVNVGSPLLAAEKIGSLLSVSAQMVALLTEQNVTRSLAALGPRDIYIRPQLDDITAADFARFATTAQRGTEATEAVSATLQPLAVDDARWRPWVYALRGERDERRPVDEVRIDGLARVAPEILQRHLNLAPEAALDTEALHRDLLRAYGDGWYEHVGYELVSTHRRQVLRLLPVEKPWGPDYLRFALNLDSTLNQGSTFSLRAALHRTWLNRLGGELLLGGELGGRTALDLQWFQPLSLTQRWFAQMDAGVSMEPRDLYLDNRRVASFDIERRKLALSAGVDLRSLGQMRLGVQSVDGRVHESVGSVLVEQAQRRRRSSGLLLELDIDQLNRLYFPTDGWALQAQWYRDLDSRYTRLRADLRANVSVGAWVFGTRTTYTGSLRGELPLFEAGTLGGFLNLSAYATGQLVADTVTYGHVRAERIVGRLPLGLRGDMRLGLALEGGRMSGSYTALEQTGRLSSVTLYLGGETPFGPVYIGIGHSAAGSNNAYLFLGTP